MINKEKTRKLHTNVHVINLKQHNLSSIALVANPHFK